MAAHRRKRGDTARPFRSVLSDDAGPVGLAAGDDVRFLLRQIEGAKFVDQPATVVAPDAPVGDPGRGVVVYEPADDDVDTPGIYRQEWEVTFAADGKAVTFPSPEWNEVVIATDLNPA